MENVEELRAQEKSNRRQCRDRWNRAIEGHTQQDLSAFLILTSERDGSSSLSSHMGGIDIRTFLSHMLGQVPVDAEAALRGEYLPCGSAVPEDPHPWVVLSRKKYSFTKSLNFFTGIGAGILVSFCAYFLATL